MAIVACSTLLATVVVSAPDDGVLIVAGATCYVEQSGMTALG